MPSPDELDSLGPCSLTPSLGGGDGEDAASDPRPPQQTASLWDKNVIAPTSELPSPPPVIEQEMEDFLPTSQTIPDEEELEENGGINYILCPKIKFALRNFHRYVAHHCI